MASINGTGKFDLKQCTIDTCPIELSFPGYVPTKAGNAFYAIWFLLMLVIQLVLSIRYRTWSYLFGQFCGLVLEIISYVNRVKLADDPFNHDYYLMYIVTNTVAPVFLAFTVYLCFGRIVLVYGRHLSRISYRAYTIIFVLMDVACFFLQAGGAAWTQVEDITAENLDRALTVLRAGLGLQVASLAVFALLSIEFAVRVWRHRNEWAPKYAHIRSKKSFFRFLIGGFTAALLILGRSAFRMAELQNGFRKGPDHQILFMVFEGAFIAIVALLLVVFHPGPVFQRHDWKTTGFFSRQPKEENVNIILQDHVGRRW